MKTTARSLYCLLACAACFGLAGCSFLKPSGVVARSFVLTPLPAAAPAATPPTTTVGIGFVRMPGYLMKDAVVMRQNTNEVVYLETAIWAERLDNSLQRVIAANLTTLPPPRQVRLSAWRPEEVSAEVYVTVEQFDVDSQGHGVLVAWWRIISPGGTKVPKTGQFRAALDGPAPNTDPSGAIATLSALAANLSGELAQALKTVVP